jgi:hypothetical protein
MGLLCAQNRNTAGTAEHSHVLTETVFMLDVIESVLNTINVYIHNKTVNECDF